MTVRDLYPHLKKDAVENFFRWRPPRPLGTGISLSEEHLWIRYEDPYAVRISCKGGEQLVEFFYVKNKRLIDLDPDRELNEEELNTIIWKFDLKSIHL